MNTLMNEIPQSPHVCLACNGSGEGVGDQKCLMCDGTGGNFEYRKFRRWCEHNDDASAQEVAEKVFELKRAELALKLERNIPHRDRARFRQNLQLIDYFAHENKIDLGLWEDMYRLASRMTVECDPVKLFNQAEAADDNPMNFPTVEVREGPKIIEAAMAEFWKDSHTADFHDGDHYLGRRNAIRGMMVRLGLYDQFTDKLADEDKTNDGSF